MCMKKQSHILIILICIQPFTLFSFGELSFNSGRNQASAGQFAKITIQGGQCFSNWEFAAGMGFIFSKAQTQDLDALKVQASRFFSPSKYPFKVTAFYQWSPYSENFSVNNFGFILNRKLKKWELNLGANSMFISLFSNHNNSNSIAKRTLWEPFNLMYRFTFRQPIAKQIDLLATITDYDNFLIWQETNPFVMVGAEYKSSKQSKLFLDIAYQSAGLLNIRVNAYGYYVRLGYTYGLDLNSQKINHDKSNHQ